ncbi:fatty acid alpha-hydroxylase [Thelotrema lepadinum]|nr:fatty acid alpha-hydroxylase [Thelotrema lepadinum]
MPGRTLPTIPTSDVESHNNSKSCYVTIGTKVFDITDFLEDHPGGGDLILDYGGKDVGEIMGDEISHTHSESAYDILDERLVGFVAREKIMNIATEIDGADNIVPLPPNAQGMKELEKRGAANGVATQPVYATTGMSSAEDLSKETDFNTDYQTHKFLDLNRPLLMQIWNGGFSKEFYLEQVHRPRHYKGGNSAPLFGNFLEPLSLTPWWAIPLVWMPPVAYLTATAYSNIGSAFETALYWFTGLAVWTIIEYGLHRFLFHADKYLPDNRVGLTLHFLLHGIHHYLPMDKYRLVMPPTLFAVLAAPFWRVAHIIFFHNWYAALAGYCGGIFGYIIYDMTHYFLHHRNLPAYYRGLKKYHLQHHFADYENGFGVSNRFWDRVFGTELPSPPPPKVIKTT